MGKKLFFAFLIVFIPALSFSQVNLVSTGVYGGALIPIGDFSDGYKTSPMVGVEGYYTISPNIDVLADISYAFLSTKFTNYTNTSFYYLESTAGVRFNFTPSKEKVFLEAGLGAYTFGSKYTFAGVDYSATTTDFGINAGVGISYPIDKSFCLSGKAKLHNIFSSGSSTNYFTIVAGVNYLFK